MSRSSFTTVQPTHDVVLLGLYHDAQQSLAKALLARHRYLHSPNAPEVPRKRRRLHESIAVPIELQGEARNWTLRSGGKRQDVLQNLLQNYDRFAGAILVVDADRVDLEPLRSQIRLANRTKIPDILVFIHDPDGASPATLEQLECGLRQLLHEEEYPGDDAEIHVGDVWSAMCSEGRDDATCRALDAILNGFARFRTDRPEPVELPLRFWVEEVATRRQGRHIVATGKVERGRIHVRQRVDVHSGTHCEPRVPVVALRRFHQAIDRAEAGDRVSVLLPGTLQTPLEPGMLLARKGSCRAFHEMSALVDSSVRTGSLLRNGTLEVKVGEMRAEASVRLEGGIPQSPHDVYVGATLTFENEHPPPFDVGTYFTLCKDAAHVGSGVITDD